MTNYRTLDLETGGKVGGLETGFGLEPWRVRHGTAHITSLAYTGPDREYQIEYPNREQLISALEALKGQEVWTWNGVFDVAWLIASIEPNKMGSIPQCILDIRWRDAMLLAKWCTNGQLADDSNFSYALVNCAATWLPDHPALAEFVKMKSNVDMDTTSDYWLRRGLLDCEFTALLAEFLWSKLPIDCYSGFIIEQRNIPTIANSWLIGIKVNKDKLALASDKLVAKAAKMSSDMGIALPVISSPKQLGNLLYNVWGLPIIAKTPTGSPSTASDTLKLLAYQTNDPRMKFITEIKETQTLISKYVKTTYEALSRTTDGFLYGAPRLFGTLTGRLTYSNKTKEEKVGIASHQLPRKDKIIREFLEPPEGKLIYELDANSQESRIMAIWSRDENMLNIFKNNMNFHSFMAARIYGREYNELQAAYIAGHPETNEQRQNGKLLNLSSNFRIGAANFAHKSFTEYDRHMSFGEAAMLLNMFKSTYPGVPEYWDRIIDFAKQNGYSYTLAGRRYKVHKWSGRDAWGTEGTVISHPIQGTAGEQFHAALAQVRESKLITTLHDASFFAVDSLEEGREIEHKMNATPYNELWNVDLPIALPYDGKIGRNFSEVK